MSAPSLAASALTMPRAAPAPAIDDQASKLRRLVREHADLPRQPVRREAPPEAPREAPREARRARVIAITSGKGGVGKTNVAVNLAAVLASAGKRVVLLDADMGLANADVLCGLDLKHNLAHVVARRKRLDEVLAPAPGGFRLAAGATGLARMADLPAEEHGRLLSSLATLEDEADLLLVDTGAGISQNVLSFTAAADRVVVVTTPEPTAITDAYATIKVILRERRAAGVEAGRLALLVNQASGQGEARRVFERVARVAGQFLGASLDDAGHVPSDAAVTRAVRRRVPFVIGEPSSRASRSMRDLAGRLEQGVAARVAGSGFFRRMIHRQIAR